MASHRPRTRRIGLVLLAPLATLAVAACSEEDRENIEEDVESAVSEIEEEARSAITEAGEAIDDAKRDAVELAARNFAARQGKEQFEDAGSPLDGDLSCEATMGEDADNVEISCTGTTEDGGEAALEGSTNEVPGASITELEGTFTGTVDGEEVFSADSLGG